MVDRYIYFYSRERIQLKTGEASRQWSLSYYNLLFLHLQALFVMSVQFEAVQLAVSAFSIPLM